MADPIQNGGPWSFHRYDNKNSAMCPFSIPTLSDDEWSTRVNWEFETGAAIRSSPCMNGFNQVFFGSDDHSLYAVDQTTGEQLWAYETNGEVSASCQVGYDWDALNEQSSVYTASEGGFIYAINSVTGQDDLPPFSTAWQGGAGSEAGGPPVMAAPYVRNHVAFGATTLFVADTNGTIHGWDVREDTVRYYVPNLAGTFAEPFSLTYGICSAVFAFRDGTIRNLNPHFMPGYEHDPRDVPGDCEDHEDLQWTYDVGGPMEAEMLTITDPDGFPPNLPATALAISAAGDLHCMTMSTVDENQEITPIGGGDRKWNVFIGGGDAVFRSPMALSVGWSTIYVCNSFGEVTAVDATTGDVMWKTILPDASCGRAGMVVDGSDQIFVPTSRGIFALSADGSILWEFSTNSEVTGSPSITEAGDLVFGTGAGKLISLTVAHTALVAGDSKKDEALDGAQIAGFIFAGAAFAAVLLFAVRRSQNGGDFPYEINTAEDDSLFEMSRSRTDVHEREV